MVFWVQICLNCEYYIWFTIIMFMFQTDGFIKFLVLHCFHYYFLSQYFIVQIYNFMIFSIFRWSYHHHRMVRHMTFMTAFLFNLMISSGTLRPPRAPKDPPATPQGPPKAFPMTSQELPMTFQGRAKLVILRNSM